MIRALPLRTLILIPAVFLIVFAIFYFENSKVMPQSAGSQEVNIVSKEEKARMYETAKEITTPDGFINTDKISISEFVAKKVVLVDFWTYSCINCQRTIPYLNAWWGRYQDDGLVIIGVHTPEFDFEGEYDNVKRAVEKFGIKYPVVLDNDYSTWIAYKNRYWPRKYLIDIDGYIVYDHIGEGGYEETEKKIREALAERAITLGIVSGLNGTVSEPEAKISVDFSKVKSPEVYFGAGRNDLLAGGLSGRTGVFDFSAPQAILPNTLYLSGRWKIENEFAETAGVQAEIIFKYDAKNVYFVGSAERPTEAEVWLDGKFIKTLSASAEDLYQAVSGKDYGQHELRLKIKTPGFRIFTFTFG